MRRLPFVFGDFQRGKLTKNEGFGALFSDQIFDMNATTLYVSTCRYILQADFENSESWGDLYRLLPYLRQSLSCCVCGSLLNDPQGPSDSNCQHFVCRKCVGGKMLLKPSCSWCKNYDKFGEVRQLKILLSCYKKLCEYIAATPIARSFVGANGESNSTLTILQEGMAINAIHESSGSRDRDKSLNILDILANANLAKASNNVSKSPRSDGTPRRRGRGRPRRERSGVEASPPMPSALRASSPVADSRLDGLCNGFDSSDHLDMSDDHNSVYSSSFSNPDSPRIKIKRKRHSNEFKVKDKKKKKKHEKDKDKRGSRGQSMLGKNQRFRTISIDQNQRGRRYSNGSDGKEKLENGVDGLSSSEDGSPRKQTVVISGHRAKLLNAGFSLPPVEGCRCGTSIKPPGSGANTCRGNRCPCYMDDKACEKCKCRGCRNPIKAGDKPKKRQNLFPRNGTASGESDLDIDVTNI